jgi:hypothetical protein
MERAEQQLPTFARASQNVAATTTLLDTLPIPSTDGVGELYQQLVNILGIAATQQAESSLQHQVEASVLTPDHSRQGAKGHPRGSGGGNGFLAGMNLSLPLHGLPM